ncbi:MULTISPECIES: YHYH domain-containing protein [unclassified Bacillus (in: firmicutes)]|uniref:YHYH domain-containing protein n=1 Tax=unclassified Bacillus (in: firmicutes) TaxID=185979 RepID=UPI002035D999|nr:MULTISPECIES: YHYH domain-containing protein [unclassified Bacillus (in: firmicutes)]
MRKHFQLFISSLCCLFLLLPSTVSAHSGRTDSNGGHNCSEKSIAKGLCSGYHYHNGGGSSSGGSSSSDSSSSSGSSSSNSTESAPSTPAPAPKVDEKQVRANEHYNTATDLYNSADYQAAIIELEKIYELKKNDSRTDTLVQKSVSAIYELAETSFRKEDNSTSKDHLAYIQDYQRSSDQIKQKAKALLEQIKENEEVVSILSKATTSRDEKNYEETLTFIQEAQKIKDTKEIKSFYNETVEALINDAEAAYQKKQYKQANKFYKLLVKIVDIPKVKAQYQTTLQQIKDEQIIQESFDINTTDFEGKSLFNHIMEEENETPYSENVVNFLESSLEEEATDAMNFIFNVNIKELFKGGKKDAA